MCEIREGNDHLPPDPEGIGQHGLQMGDLLQGLVQDDVIKGIVWVLDQAAVYVSVKDAQPLRDTTMNRLLVDVDALGLHALFLDEARQQLTVAAAQVQDG